jgi:integration host factor subunit beta
MIKSQLVLRISGQNPHLFNRDVKKVVDAIFDEIEAALARRDRVELRSFGAFFLRTRSARPARNPKNGVKVSVPEKFHPSFKTGKEMHRRLNGTPGSALRAAFHKASNAAEPIDPKA